jgi:hypothetical protein
VHPYIPRILKLPVELRLIIHKMYLESEVTHQDRRDAEDDNIRKPLAKWPDITVAMSSSAWVLQIAEGRHNPFGPSFAPRIFGSSHKLRNEVLDVFLTKARFTVRGQHDELHLHAFLNNFASPRVFELVQRLKFQGPNTRVASNVQFVRHIPMLRRLDLRFNVMTLFNPFDGETRAAKSCDIVIKQNSHDMLLHYQNLEEVTLHIATINGKYGLPWIGDDLKVLCEVGSWLTDKFAQKKQNVVVKYERSHISAHNRFGVHNLILNMLPQLIKSLNWG